ncbi:MAG TPA: serine/threonine-protein kinase [Acetobacteraceae bacterium]|nr:serine/threonine-protein kinase [Acetobacteraceae bacterium]
MTDIPAAPDMPPQIGRYRVQRLLGQGAMGVVYAAHDPVIDRTVAIKLMRIDLLEGTDRADFVARFQREAQAAARCMHPNIVAVYDFALHEGNPFLAMEFVQGTSLATRLRQGPRFAPEEAVAILRQMLDALGGAHAAGVVHRDVKPANILLLDGNRVKMTDFGIARFDGSELTQTGAVIGTPSYMSPEQCRGDPVDARSDLFSAGAVFYEMLTGERPFGGGNATQVIYRLMQEEPPALVTPHPLMPANLAAVLRRALAKRAADRFASAEAMAAALQAPADATVIAPPVSTSPARIAPDEVARAEQALAEYLGPIARVLVKRALPDARSPAALWAALAAHIDGAADRAAFLRQAAG